MSLTITIGPESLSNELPQIVLQNLIWRCPGFQDDECTCCFSSKLVSSTNHCSFRDAWMLKQCALNFDGTNSMGGDLYDLVNSSQEPEISITHPSLPRRRSCIRQESCSNNSRRIFDDHARGLALGREMAVSLRKYLRLLASQDFLAHQRSKRPLPEAELSLIQV